MLQRLNALRGCEAGGAQRHGVEVRAIDVMRSNERADLEPVRAGDDDSLLDEGRRRSVDRLARRCVQQRPVVDRGAQDRDRATTSFDRASVSRRICRLISESSGRNTNARL